MATSRLTVRLAVSTAVVAIGLGVASPAFAVDYPPTSGGQTSVLGETTVRTPAVTPPVKVAGITDSRSSATVPSSKALAFTGSDAIVGGLVLGSTLVIAGTGAMFVGRRRKIA